MISVTEYGQFEHLRADLFDAIGRSLDRDGHCKSYEGSFRIQFPNYFESRQFEPRPTHLQRPWGIFLDCYVIGPGRHNEWWGETFAEVLHAAETDIRAWIHEADEEANEE